MNQFKEDVLRELQEVKLTDEKKQAIAQKARRKSTRRGSSPWQYRAVLTTFIIIVISFSFLLLQNKNQPLKTQHQTASQPEVDTSVMWVVLENDWFRGILLISLFMIVAIFTKLRLKKKRFGLPTCIQCGEKWALKQAHKFYWKNGEIECPNCGKKQYRSKKSMQLAGMVNMHLPLIIFTHYFFDNLFIGIGCYLVGAIFLIYQITPYLFELQEDDPTNTPLW
ncbi:TIGR04104 family putative zinc finger protein [Lysinibacillus sp. NPDC097231]|uniref:TIGR04104 family putative zinc finger protein n=1 Tax=Lysinibacillus sp. NPDC097231 TaxID=3364142 RepID=UPI0037FB968F